MGISFLWPVVLVMSALLLTCDRGNVMPPDDAVNSDPAALVGVWIPASATIESTDESQDASGAITPSMWADIYGPNAEVFVEFSDSSCTFYAYAADSTYYYRARSPYVRGLDSVSWSVLMLDSVNLYLSQVGLVRNTTFAIKGSNLVQETSQTDMIVDSTSYSSVTSGIKVSFQKHSGAFPPAHWPAQYRDVTPCSFGLEDVNAN